MSISRLGMAYGRFFDSNISDGALSVNGFTGSGFSVALGNGIGY